MTDLLTSFVPARCRAFGLLSPGASPMTQEATTLFVDIVGFTPLTDRLGRLGTRGTEELSALLARFFGSVTEVVTAEGGDPVAYGGDALTVVYDGPAEETLDAAVRSAAGIQALAGRTTGVETAAGPVDLRTRVGVARGPVTTAVAHSADRSVPVHLGAGLDDAVAAEGMASAGQVVVHPSVGNGAAASAPPAAGATTTADAAVRRAPSTARTATARTSLAVDRAQASRLLHPVVLARLEAGGALLESHRTVSVAFVRFPPVQERGIESFLTEIGVVLGLVERKGGDVVQVSGGDKGVVAMLVFGTPVARDDDALLAAETVAEIRRHVPAAAAGVATGQVYTALLGSPERRFATNSGTAVNLAARLTAAAAPGQVLVDDATWQASSGHLRAAGAASSLRLKGLADPVQAHAVTGRRAVRRRASPAPDTPVVGRVAELEQVERLLEDVSGGVGHVLLVAGEPGSGKTRLVREAVARARARETPVVLVDVDDHPRGTAAPVWRAVLAGLTGTPPTAGAATWRTVLERLLPGDGRRLPALLALLGLRVPASAGTHGLPPDIESRLAGDLFVRAVHAAATRPSLVVVENVHHLDDPATMLLDRLVGHLSGSVTGVLLTRRSPVPARTAGAAAAAPPPGRGAQDEDVLWLTDLSTDDARALVTDTWARSGGGSPPPWLHEAVTRWGGGNPLFLRTLTETARGRWRPGQPAPATASVPGLLASAMSERIDHLPVRARLLLDALAVARRAVEAEAAASVLSPEMDPGATSESAADLAAAGLVETDVPGKVLRVKHDVLRDVVYESMSHSRRTTLHRRLADELADRDADPVEVAEHVARLGDADRARQWYPLAAAQARRSWALGEAVAWWRLVLPLVGGADRAAAVVELLELLLVAGAPSEVLSVSGDEQALLAGADAPLRARAEQAVATASFDQGDLDASGEAAARVMALTDGVDERRYQRAAELDVRVRSERGDAAGAVAAARAHLERAEDAGDDGALLTARSSLGAALLLGGHPAEAATHFESALETAERLGDVVQQVHVLSDLAGCRCESGDFAGCLALLARAREVADTVGYRKHLAYNLVNEAHLRGSLGDAAAPAVAQAAVGRNLDDGDLSMASNAVNAWVTADPALAAGRRTWERLVAVDEALGRHSAAAEGWAELAVVEARAGHRERARRAAAVAARGADELELPHVRPRVALALALLDPPSPGDGDGDLTGLERAELAVHRWRRSGTADDRVAAHLLVRETLEAQPSALVRGWFDDLAEGGATGPPPAGPQLPPPVGIGAARPSRADFARSLARLEAAVAARQSPGGV